MAKLTFVEQCESTNDLILDFLDPEYKDICALYTLNQTKGRGQYGNIWNSDQNKNIAFSAALRCDFYSQDFINFHTAVILRDFLANLTHSEVFIKWPNDLILKNKKIAGILIERKKVKNHFFYIIGMGLNVLQEDFLNLPKAGSILTQTGLKFQPKPLAKQLFEFLSLQLSAETSPEKIHTIYNDWLFRKNKVSVFEIDKIRQNGIIQTVDQKGQLWINLEKDGVKSFARQEISLLY